MSEEFCICSLPEKCTKGTILRFHGDGKRSIKIIIGIGQKINLGSTEDKNSLETLQDDYFAEFECIEDDFVFVPTQCAQNFIIYPEGEKKG